MDNTGNKPRRPSLFNTGPAGASATPPVATLDTVDKAVATEASATRKRRPAPWRAGILVVGVLVIGALAFVLLTGSPSGDGVPAIAGSSQPVPPPQPPAQQDSAAVLLPDAPTPQTGNPLDRLSAAQPAGGATPHPGSPPAASAALDSPPATASRVASAGAARQPARNAPQARRSSTQAQDMVASTELMRTLLGHINGSEPQQLVASNSPRSLDDLIQDLIDRDVNGPTNALDTGSPELQDALRKCPAANSVSGIACRQQVCGSYGGRDPACPRQ